MIYIYGATILCCVPMLVANTSYNTFEAGLKNARTLVALQWIYQSIRNHILLLLLFPIAYFFGVWLYYKRKIFVKKMRTESTLFKNHAEYKAFRLHIDSLLVLNPSLEKLSVYNVKNSQLLFRYTAGQMKKMASTLLTYNSWLENKLNSLNEERLKENSNVFKFIPEKDLWENRNQAYQYWM